MLDDPEFQAAIERAREEINVKLRTELCKHNQRAFDDQGKPSLCPECLAEKARKSDGFWNNAKDYMDGVQPLAQPEAHPRPTNFMDTPGFPEPEKKS